MSPPAVVVAARTGGAFAHLMDESIHLNDHHSDDATYICSNCGETSGRRKYFSASRNALQPK
jgi:hypothetical protein